MKKKQEKTIIEKKNLNKGLGFNYNNKLLSLYGLKKIKNKKFINYFNNMGENLLIIQKQQENFLDLLSIYQKLINFEITNKSYKGLRILSKLPLRGQRTHTNAKTARKLLKIK